jgi:sulfatase modifying factor 1
MMPARAEQHSETRIGMRLVSGGVFWMGSDDHYPEEAPARQVRVDDFWIDMTPVTNLQFAQFVQATGHVTLAESAPDPALYPGAPGHMLRAGSSLFVPPQRHVGSGDNLNWWTFCFGADWQHPEGLGSGIDDRLDHPVVHVAYADAAAYAAWSGKALPTEAEWEYAARGGLDRAAYAWGDNLAPDGRMMANYWQGQFPGQNLMTDGYAGTSPVGSFPVNPYGLYDMIGNVWEWTADWYGTPLKTGASPSCCIPGNPRGADEKDSHDPANLGAGFPRKVLKGGSHLCATNYCQRYRPAARYPQTIDTSTSHIGFRCVAPGYAGK